ncbi:hypothetical protein HK099_001111 [Clydaea vesicula]|uniref:Uncharacterized protein n=1 Tax=Clydaea vesicula TaxID=447962 RepID=A0AAD5TTY8_9FUNG|nr:hypothetical protein HK099_001111 [Clydaea vesicula]
MNQKLNISCFFIINSKSLPTEHGVTLLEIKNHNLLSYITNLSYYLLLKLNGKKVEDENVISKLIELRVVLEKCKPLEAKLKYQLDKLIKMATMKEDLSLVHNYDGVIDEEEETQFKPNPLGLMKEVEKKSSAEFNDDKKAEIYKPPRIAPMHYNPDERDRTKLSQKMKQKAASSRLINELRKQYDSRPEEESAEGTGYGTKEKGNKLDGKQ